MRSWVTPSSRPTSSRLQLRPSSKPYDFQFVISGSLQSYVHSFGLEFRNVPILRVSTQRVIVEVEVPQVV